jgi:heme/copper-type cytochrome/quinol oxidase subunit 3
MRQRALATFAAVLLTTAALAAQPAAPAPPVPPGAAPAPAAPVFQVPTDANETRDQLQELLRQYPPAVGEVLRRDPSLLSRPDYIAPYPQLVAYLQQHPEILRNPTYFFGGYDYYEQRRTPMSPEVEALGVLLGGLGGFLGFGAFFAILVWLVRAVIQHRRWLRQSKVQSDVHTKLMDRMTTNEELLAYIQSPAGRRFLESAPMQQEPDSPRMGAAPVGPIIWSMMAGIVLATVGVGFRFAANSVTNEAQQAFTVVGVILLALGAGFVVASVMAYLVSSRLGLFPARAATPDASAGNA